MADLPDLPDRVKNVSNEGLEDFLAKDAAVQKEMAKKPEAGSFSAPQDGPRLNTEGTESNSMVFVGKDLYIRRN